VNIVLKKKILFSVLGLLLLVAGIARASENRSQLVAKGDALFSIRGKVHTGSWASVKNISMALKAYLKAYDAKNPGPELTARIMDAEYFYATYAEKSPGKEKEALSKALEIGQKALDKYPDDVAVNYWMAGCWGRWGEVNGIMASARKGVADKVKMYAEKTIKLDPAYAEAGGYRTLGRLHYKAPWIPFILSWPSKKESVRYLQMAVKDAPENTTNRLFYGESLAEVGKTADALKNLNFVANAEAKGEKVVEILRDKEEALVAMKELK